MEDLGLVPIFNGKLDDFVSSWFYDNINSVKLHDFFTGHGSEYNIKVDKESLASVWRTN